MSAILPKFSNANTMGGSHVIKGPLLYLVVFCLPVLMIIGAVSTYLDYKFNELNIASSLRLARLVDSANINMWNNIHQKESIFNAVNHGKEFPRTDRLSGLYQKRILITGGAGFVGSHLVDKLMKQGHSVTVVDNLFTGRKENIEHWIGHQNFEFKIHDVVEPLLLEVDQIYHLACPASPPHYQYNPIKTIKTSSVGTLNMLGLASRVKARLLLASTSEVYGDPEIHPQTEDYWGHVNPIGPRACYDEGKRIAETLCYAYKQQENADVRVARIFNTFGPRMHPNDGRVVSNFIVQSLQNRSITVYGDGKQTRSFQYVEDLVDGLIALMNSAYEYPVNLGNPEEFTINHFATLIRNSISPSTPIVHMSAAVDDPRKRLPDITVAKKHLNWQPKWSVKDGLEQTINYFRNELNEKFDNEQLNNRYQTHYVKSDNVLT